MPLTTSPSNRRRVAWSLLLSVLLLATIAVATAPQRPVLAQAGNGTVVISSGRLNVRGGPGATFAIVGKLPAGSVVSILEKSADGNWLRIAADSLGVEGWVAAAFIEQGGAAATGPGPGLSGLAGVALSAATPVVTLPTPTPRAGAGVVLRSSPTVTATLMTTATAVVTAPTAVVPAPTAVVTASAAVVAAPTVAPTVAPPAAPAAAAEAPDAPTAYVAPAAINVRSGPGTNYARQGSATQGSALTITGIAPAGDWYRITQADGQEGWVNAALVTTAGPLDQAPTLGEVDIPTAPVAVAAAAANATADAAGAAGEAGAAVDSAPQPSGGGGFAYGLTANLWQGDKAGVAGMLNDLGAHWVKQQVRWEFVETSPGAVNWQEMDSIISQMNASGINTAFSIVTAPAWTRPNKGGTNGPPEDFQTYANFVGAVAGRYCGQSLKAIEVWNEQNLQREWEGYPLDPALYMDLLKRAYASIKAACPSMIVVSGATTPAGYSDVAFDDIDYLRGMYQNGLARYSDAVGIHPSGFANPPNIRFADWQSGAYTALSHANHRSFYFLSTLEESHAVMEQNGDGGKKLWPTEFGWGSSPAPEAGYEYQARISEQQQADWTTEAYRIMAGSGYVGVAFLWNLNYDFGEMRTFAIVGRPAYDALKALIRQ